METAVSSHKVTIANNGGAQRSEWREIGLPPGVVREITGGGARQIGLRDSAGQVHRCYPGRQIPDVEFWLVEATVPGFSSPEFDLVAIDHEPTPEPFALHQFAGDDLSKLSLLLDVQDSMGVEHTLADWQWSVVENTSRRSVFRLCNFVPGTPVHATVFAYAYHRQAHIRLEVLIGMGGVTIGRELVSYQVRRINLRSGECVSIEHSIRSGVAGFQRDRQGFYNVQLSGPRSLGRAELLPYFGWMLTLPSTPGVETDRRFDNNFRSLLDGSCCAATFQGWDGHYSTLKVIPQETFDVQPNSLNLEHVRSHRERGDIYDQRSLGLLKNAGSTGAQDDFGSSQDQAALAHADPRRQAALQWGMHGWFLRPFHNREDNGRPIRFFAHPNVRTWSQIPERRVGSGDSLGWPERLPSHWPCSDYTGIDDQHRSQELVTCWMHLVDSHAAQMLLLDLVQTDVAQAKVYQESMDSPRAEGRCLDAWADMLGLMDDGALRTQMLEHGHRRLGVVDRNWVGKGLPADRVRPLYIGTSPSLAGGHNTPAVVVWEHAIAAMGFYSWWKRTGSDVARRLCKATCELVVRHGTFLLEGQWWCVQAFAWQADGVPLPAAHYQPGSATVTADNAGWWTWTLPAVLILAHEWPDHPDHARAVDICRDVYNTGPRTEDQSEWWAVVPHRSWGAVDGEDVNLINHAGLVPPELELPPITAEQIAEGEKAVREGRTTSLSDLRAESVPVEVAAEPPPAEEPVQVPADAPPAEAVASVTAEEATPAAGLAE